MGRTIKLYRWRYYDEVRKRWITTKHHEREEVFLARHPDAEKVPGSEEVRNIPEDEAAQGRPGIKLW